MDEETHILLKGESGMPQDDPFITLYALPSELPAIEEAVVVYIRLVEATVPPSEERSEVIKMLRSFQWRYREALSVVQATRGKKHSSQQERLIPVQATQYELIAFATAVMGYISVLEKSGVPPQEQREVLTPLLRFQKRYIDSAPPATPLSD